jgi:hypothetical protein
MERRTGRVASAVLLGSYLGAGYAMAEPYQRLTGRGEAGSSVRRALDGARERLARKGCDGVLDEFTDASGQTLRANLDALSLTPSDYLEYLVFFDAGGEGRCRATRVLAMTTPGSRAVFVCGDRFVKMGRHDQRYTEMVLIHEALHTLGLGENPPSSANITARVLARCGR